MIWFGAFYYLILMSNVTITFNIKIKDTKIYQGGKTNVQF